MTSLATYDRLISSVEAGAATGTLISQAFDSVTPIFASAMRKDEAWCAYRGDMNAALSLKEALLPGWLVENISQHRDLKWWVSLHRPVEGDEAGNITRHGATVAVFDQPDPARALLLAILRAKRSELEATQ